MIDSLKGWWEEEKVMGNAGFVLHTKLKRLKEKIKLWVKYNLGKIVHKISLLEGLLLEVESEEEELLTEDNLFKKHCCNLDLREAFKAEELYWSNKAHVSWK